MSRVLVLLGQAVVVRNTYSKMWSFAIFAQNFHFIHYYCLTVVMLLSTSSLPSMALPSSVEVVWCVFYRSRTACRYLLATDQR